MQANAGGRLLHEGQSIDEQGNVVGDMPQTDTLGFRWSAVNNLFLTGGDVAADEWRGGRDVGVAVLGDRHPGHQLHHKIRPAPLVASHDERALQCQSLTTGWMPFSALR